MFASGGAKSCPKRLSLLNYPSELRSNLFWRGIGNPRPCRQRQSCRIAQNSAELLRDVRSRLLSLEQQVVTAMRPFWKLGA
jgi:hypothetical protein